MFCFSYKYKSTLCTCVCMHAPVMGTYFYVDCGQKSLKSVLRDSGHQGQVRQDFTSKKTLGQRLSTQTTNDHSSAVSQYSIMFKSIHRLWY